MELEAPAPKPIDPIDFGIDFAELLMKRNQWTLPVQLNEIEFPGVLAMAFIAGRESARRGQK